MRVRRSRNWRRFWIGTCSRWWTSTPKAASKSNRAQPGRNWWRAGTRLFLVKVINRANVTAPLRVASPNSGNVYIQSTGSPEPKLELTPPECRRALGRYLDI